jgi:hypothetical protein
MPSCPAQRYRWPGRWQGLPTGRFANRPDPEGPPNNLPHKRAKKEMDGSTTDWRPSLSWDFAPMALRRRAEAGSGLFEAADAEQGELDFIG